MVLSKNLKITYNFENNFVGRSKLIM